MRRLCAVVLVCEAIVIALAIPVAISVVHADSKAAGIAGGVLAVACVLLAGLLRFRWAFVAGGLLQLVVIATVFGALWVTAIWLGRKAERIEAR